MKKVRILWSGITGRTGKEAVKIAKKSDDVEIVAGICRTDDNYYHYDQLDNINEEFDIIIDFSHKDSFDKILNYALKVKKPIIIGTAKLSDEQIKLCEEASNIIPVFKGGNFRYKVKSFIDSVVDYAKNCDEEDIFLIETFYKGKTLPSETGKVIKEKVFNETGKNIIIKSYLEYEDPISDWKVQNLHCRVCGFKELAEDVLKIAIMMKDKKADGVYDLDRLLSEYN